MNELHWVTDCILWLLNLLIPALTWALVIAGLTWIIKGTGSRDVSKQSEDPILIGSGMLCTGMNRVDTSLETPGCILCKTYPVERDGQPGVAGDQSNDNLTQ